MNERGRGRGARGEGTETDKLYNTRWCRSPSSLKDTTSAVRDKQGEVIVDVGSEMHGTAASNRGQIRVVVFYSLPGEVGSDIGMVRVDAVGNAVPNDGG